MSWPNKNDRENLEFEKIFSDYEKIEEIHVQEVKKQERPDYIVCSIAKATNESESLGFELTSVYIADESVPRRHLVNKLFHIEENEFAIKKLLMNITNSIQKKNQLAKTYEPCDKLILGVYMNEYEKLYLDRLEDWYTWMLTLNLNNLVFSKVLISNLPNNHVFAFDGMKNFWWK